MSGDDRVAVAALLAAAAALPIVAGWAPAALLFRAPRVRPWATLLAPPLGFATILAIVFAFRESMIGTSFLTGPAMLVLGLGAVASWLLGVRPRIPRKARAAVAASGLAFALASAPLFVVGRPTTIGAELDTLVYYVRAGAIARAGPSAASATGPDTYLARTGERRHQGGAALLAALGSATGAEPHLAFSALMAALYGCLPLLAWCLARGPARTTARAANAAAFLVAVQPFLFWIAMDTFLSQIGGLVALLFFVVAGFAAVRRPFSIGTALAALLAGVFLGTTYPTYGPFAGAMVILPLALASSGRALFRRVAGSLAVLAVLAAGLKPAGSLDFLFHVVGMLVDPTTSGAGNQPRFAHVGEALGLVSHFHEVLRLPVASPPRGFVSVALAIALALGLYPTLRGRVAGRPFALATFLTFGGGLAILRWIAGGGAGIPYAFFKVLAAASPFLVVVTCAGLALAFRDARRPSGPAGRATRAALALAALALAAAPVLTLATSFPTAQRLSARMTPAFLDQAASFRRHLLADEPILLADPDVLEHMWIVWLVRDRTVRRYGHLGGDVGDPMGVASRLPRHAIVRTATAADNVESAGFLDPRRWRVVVDGPTHRLLERAPGTRAEATSASEIGAPTFARPLEVRLTPSHLTVRTSLADPRHQRLEGPASAVVLTVFSERAATLTAARGSGSVTVPVRPGLQDVTLPPEPAWTFTASDRSPRLIAIRVSGAAP